MPAGGEKKIFFAVKKGKWLELPAEGKITI